MRAGYLIPENEGSGTRNVPQPIPGIIPYWNVAIPACSPGHVLPLYREQGMKWVDLKT
jgi:hypothetical protein